MPAIFEYHHTVCNDEIDALGHANNVCYVRWMQDAAVAHSTALGWPGQAYRRLGSGWVVRSHAIEYRQPARAGDRIVVQTWVAAFKRVTSLRRYRIVRPADAALLATAETQWAFINFATGQPARAHGDRAGLSGRGGRTGNNSLISSVRSFAFCNARGLPAGQLRSKLHTGFHAKPRFPAFPAAAKPPPGTRENGDRGSRLVAMNVTIPRASRGAFDPEVV